MSKIVFTIVAICVAQIVVARNVREAPAPTPTDKDGLTAIWDSANDTFTALGAAFLRVVNSDSNAELLDKVQKELKTLANEVESNVVKITEETKPLTGKAGEFVKSFTDKVTEISEKLKAENPEFVEKHVRALADEAEKLKTRLDKENEVLSEKAQGLIKVIFENTVATAVQLKTQVEAAIASKTN